MARELSATLIEAQKWGIIRYPYLIVKIRRKWGGVIRYEYTQLYSGSEYDGPHCAAMPSDGSLIRLRVTSSGDSRKLYYQRLVDPGIPPDAFPYTFPFTFASPGADYGDWTYLSLYDVLAVASCAYEAKVSQFYIKTDRKIYHRESTDCGASWGSWSLIGYTTTPGVTDCGAAYKPNGDIGLVWTDQADVCIMRRVGGGWGSKVTWGETTGNLSGIDVYYYEDWNIVITGLDASDNPTVWTIIYGDGGRVTAGTWGNLDTLISRGSTEPFTYCGPFIARPDTTRLYFTEQYTDPEATNHVFYSHMPPSAHFDDAAWLEPVPMEPESENGLAFCQQGSYAWLSNANQVYRASVSDEELDISTKLLTVDLQQAPDIQRGKLKISVDNTAGLYNNFARKGDEITIGIGYKTAAGNEYSLASSYWITKYELRSPQYTFWRAIYPPGIIGTLYIEAQDAWDFLKRYKARRPFEWAAGEKSVLQLLQYFFARAGLDFVVISSSSAAQNFEPEFEKGRGAKFSTIIKGLLKLIPDQVFFREATAYLRNPTTGEAVDWTYNNALGTALLLYRGKYGTSAWDPNRAEVWGDTLMKSGADWDEVGKMRDRLARVTEPDYPDLTRAAERVDAELRKAEVLTGEDSWLLTPVNCGLEPWDKIDITDSVAGVANIKRRIKRINLHWSKKDWSYYQTLLMGAD